MVKESTAIKKKRKTSANPDNEGDADIYKKVVDFEEKEALSRDASVDMQILLNLCQEIRESLATVYAEKMSKKPISMELITDIALKIALIKKLNRTDKIQNVFAKDSLFKEKQKCDTIKLVYQNLVYELNHLIHEVTKCNSFKSKHEEIELVDVKEFFKEAPPELINKLDEKNLNSDHQLCLARLEYELKQRKMLAAQYKSLQEEKKKVSADIIERKNKLEGLLPLLSVVISATKPLQDYLNMPTDKIREEHKLASMLPDALYIFYSHAVAYSNVYDIDLKAEILGDSEEAQLFNNKVETSEDDESESVDTESQETEEIVEVKKRRHRKSVQVDPMEEKKKKLLERHPLSVEVKLTEKDLPGFSFTVCYYTKLKIVTVTSKADISSKITGNCAREILTGENILSELTPGDLGLDSPNPNTSYQLKKANLGSFQSLVPQIGYAYNWAQNCCGLHFLSQKYSVEEVSRTHVETVLKTLLKRLSSRSNLANQLQQLEQNIIPAVPSNVTVPQNTISSISKWSSATYQNFCQSDFTQGIVEEDIVSPSDMFFTLTITRANAQLQSFVAIKNSYPTPPPLFILNFKYNGDVLHSGNSDNIRDMERTINFNIAKDGEKNSSWLLSAQVSYLCSFLDVYLETQHSEEFPQSVMFLKKICGKNRRSPYKFRKIGTGLFTVY